MRVLDEGACSQILARYQSRPVSDLGYATVEDFCDGADFLPQICRLDGDLKNVQRPWMVKAILGRVPLGSRLLEIGGGEPLVAGALCDLGYDVTIADPYEGTGGGPTTFEAYASAYPEVRIVRAEFRKQVAEIAGESFGGIYSISVLEHVPHARLQDLFEGIALFLHPGGQSIHCVDHVLEGAGAHYHAEGLREVLREQDALRERRSGIRTPEHDPLPALLQSMATDLETFYLSALGHHQWRGGRSYREFPFRKVVSIQTCAAFSP